MLEEGCMNAVYVLSRTELTVSCILSTELHLQTLSDYFDNSVLKSICGNLISCSV